MFILRDLQDFEGNLHFVQKVYQGSCEFDVVYNNALTPITERITFENLKFRIQNSLKAFDEKFNNHFELAPPFNSKKYKKFGGKEVLSGLLGGLSYFYGDQLVDRKLYLMKIRLRVTNWKVLLKAHTSCLLWFLQDHFSTRGFFGMKGSIYCHC